MDHLQKPRRGPRNLGPGKLGWAECLLWVLSLLITSGYGLAVIFVGGLVALAYVVFGGMDSGHKKEALLSLLGWPGFGLAGWVVAVVTVLVARRMLQIQERAFEGRISEARKAKEEALSLQQDLRLELGDAKKSSDNQK